MLNSKTSELVSCGRGKCFQRTGLLPLVLQISGLQCILLQESRIQKTTNAVAGEVFELIFDTDIWEHLS